ncbi:hypothetical protein [Rubrivirga sp. IMCC43871]|uniref:hypothetical protein n=1 Tax=Rubrivirga sp. IMCC43871 TaxID=3391575 RepID=UPI00399001A4
MPETDPTITPRCTRCGSDEMIPDAFLYAEGYGAAKLAVGVNKNPTARVMKGPVRTPLRFKVCGDCGLVEAEAEDPHALWEAHVERLTREFED